MFIVLLGPLQSPSLLRTPLSCRRFSSAPSRQARPHRHRHAPYCSPPGVRLVPCRVVWTPSCSVYTYSSRIQAALVTQERPATSHRPAHPSMKQPTALEGSPLRIPLLLFSPVISPPPDSGTRPEYPFRRLTRSYYGVNGAVLRNPPTDTPSWPLYQTSG